ncbi:MAG: patatin-like phospholipase family protein [Cyclobacteriaceae bacterium]
MENHTTNDETFHLGITMAGAVSAGCYTGGVMDYLFEVLDLWEKGKAGELAVDDKLVPKHKVIIDVMGGTSAGGMTTSMAAAYAIQNKINPVKDDQVNQPGTWKDNIFYDSWVNLIDQQGKPTLLQALDVDDLADGKIQSLINSEFIDKIAKRALAFPDSQGASNHPTYISDNLEVLLSHTMMRGIPLAVSFANNTNKDSLRDAPKHFTYEHFLFSHFRLNAEDDKWEKYIPFNPYNKKVREHLIKATIATGAFPVGLRFRNFDGSSFNESYLKTIASRLITRSMGDDSPDIMEQIIWDDTMLQNYASNSVDGGAINNEPFGEVMGVLKYRYGSALQKFSNTMEGSNEKVEKDYQKYGVIMIDPFPDFNEAKGEYKLSDNLTGLIPRIIGSLWNQSRVKRHEMIEQFANPAYRGVIFPVKHKLNSDGERTGQYDYPIASGTLHAFGGFLDVSFRHHDFYLGRNNARNFIRAFFSMPYNPKNGVVHPIHQNWTNEMVEKFLIKMNGKEYLPIIPDINILINNESPDSEKYGYSIPDMPKISTEKIELLRDPIKARIGKIVDIVANMLMPAKKIKWWQFVRRIKKNQINKLKAKQVENLTNKTIEHIDNNLIERGFHE